MEKDFDTWNKVKKDIHLKQTGLFCNTREIWWASIGLNVGSEEDGKNDLFERPVLIIKIFNRDMVRIVPITSTRREDDNHIYFEYENVAGSIRLSQMKTISTKRLSRKICRLDSDTFLLITDKLIKSLI